MKMFFKKKKNKKTHRTVFSVGLVAPWPKSAFWKLFSRPGSHQQPWLREKGLEACGLECVNVEIKHRSLFSITTTSLWFWLPACWVFRCCVVSCSYRLELLRGFFFFFFFFFFLPHLRHLGVPRLGVKLELQLPANATATAMPDPSSICDLPRSSSRQCQIVNPLSKARDRTCILTDSGWIHFCCATMGTPALSTYDELGVECSMNIIDMILALRDLTG